MSKIPLILLDIKEEEKLPYENIQTLVIQSEDFKYDAKSQTSNVITMGETSPTTTSSVAGTTGLFGGDSDESNDDEGKD